MDRLVMFGQNIHLLIGLLCACCGLSVLLLVLILAARSLLWYVDKKRIEAEMRRPYCDVDGEALSPPVRGACNRCGNIFPQVFEQPDGRRLCLRCYRIERGKEPDNPAPPAGERPMG